MKLFFTFIIVVLVTLSVAIMLDSKTVKTMNRSITVAGVANEISNTLFETPEETKPARKPPLQPVSAKQMRILLDVFAPELQ